MTRAFGILLARQRSGTGALGTTLDRQTGVRYLGEVFHPANIGQERNYFTHVRAAVEQDSGNVTPDRSLPLLYKFLETVVPDQNRLPIMDVKYNSLHHIRPGFHAPDAVPQLIGECRENQYPIIHLQRRNLVEVFVSGLIADANKVWHARSNDEIKVQSVEVNPAKLLRFLAAMRRQDQQIREWLGAKTRVLNVYYEDMFSGPTELSEKMCGSIASFLDVPHFEDREVRIVKQNAATIDNAISNYPEILETLLGSEFEWMLRRQKE